MQQEPEVIKPVGIIAVIDTEDTDSVTKVGIGFIEEDLNKLVAEVVGSFDINWGTTGSYGAI